MKTKLTLALVAIITSSAYAGIPKVLPEFKNARQLAEWRDEMAAKHATTTTATEDHAFYTGKPYIASTDSYAFKYRSYNPELARWTSEDPSGFPDGANNFSYGSPTTGVDPTGLAWVFVGANNNDNYHVEKDIPVDVDFNYGGGYSISGYSNGIATFLSLTVNGYSNLHGWLYTSGKATLPTMIITLIINPISGEVTMSGNVQESDADSFQITSQALVGAHVGIEDRVNVTQGMVAFNHGAITHGNTEISFTGTALGVGVSFGSNIQSSDWAFPKTIAFSLSKQYLE